MNNRSIASLLNSGAIDMAQVADSAYRILWPLFAVGAFDKPNNHSSNNDVRTPLNTELAKNFSAAGTVLLKNTGILPIATPGSISSSKGQTVISKSIAVIGAQAARPIVTGGGSGAVSTKYVVSPLQGICERLKVAIPKQQARVVSGTVCSVT